MSNLRSYFAPLSFCSITSVVAEQMKEFFLSTGVYTCTEKEKEDGLHLAFWVGSAATPEQAEEIEQEWSTRLHPLVLLCSDLGTVENLALVRDEYLSPLTQYAESLGAIVHLGHGSAGLGCVDEEALFYSDFLLVEVTELSSSCAAEWLCYMLATVELYRSGDPDWRWSTAAWARAEELFVSFYPHESVNFSMFREYTESV